MSSTRKRKVAYFYDPDIGQYYYGQGHPMKPHRVRMAHSLIMNYGLFSEMSCYKPYTVEKEEMKDFHAEDYVDFLSTVGGQPGSVAHRYLNQQLRLFNMMDDCPLFDGLWRYCQISTGGSLGSAVKLNHGEAEIAINWSGGLHHAKRSEASGFCYVNDIVLAILELLKYHQRVLYVDIDVHHGDGVEEAFLTTDRVMTLSFHKFGDGFFPGTGDLYNVGHGQGKHYTVNVPLRDGIDDSTYASLFKPIVSKIMQVYSPDVVVLQCGADSLGHDRLGKLNLSSDGHSECVKFLRSFDIPMMLLGGGGYTIKNVARCWALETAVAIGTNVGPNLPINEYYEYYKPDFEMHVCAQNERVNENDAAYIRHMLEHVMHHLSHVNPVPSVAFIERPPDAIPVDAIPAHEDGHDVIQSPRKPPQQMWSHI